MIIARGFPKGKHGEMAYLEKYDDLRSDPRRLLDGGAGSDFHCCNYHWGNGGATADSSGGTSTVPE